MKLKRITAAIMAVAMATSVSVTPALATELNTPNSVEASTDIDVDGESIVDDETDGTESPDSGLEFQESNDATDDTLGEDSNSEDSSSTVGDAANESVVQPSESDDDTLYITQEEADAIALADTSDKEASTEVKASVESSYTLIVPESVSMVGDDGTGEKTATIPVLLKGDIPEGKAVYVTTDASPLQRSGSEDAPMNITAPKTQWNRDELLGEGTASDYTATATLTPGSWSGTVVFNCELCEGATFTTKSLWPILQEQYNNENPITSISFGAYNIPIDTSLYDVSDNQSGDVVAFVKGDSLFVTNKDKSPLRFSAGNSLSLYRKDYSSYKVFMECIKTLSYESVDTSRVTDLSYAFGHDYSQWNSADYKLSALTGIYGLENWNTSNVTKMEYLFGSCPSLTNVDVANWDTSKVSDMAGMFYECTSLQNLDLNKWDTSNVTSIAAMFYNCSALSQLKVSNWNTHNVTDMHSAFRYCKSLLSLDINAWDTHNVTNISYLFSDCSSLSSLTLNSWDTSNVVNMHSVFSSCSSLQSLSIDTWDTSNVNNMGYMFQMCSSLLTLNLNNWNTGNVNYMFGMFDCCSKLQTLVVDSWDTCNVVNMSLMFRSCNSLSSIDVSKWNVRNVSSVQSMFDNCYSLKTLNVYGWDTKNVTNYVRFAYDSGITEIIVNDTFASANLPPAGKGSWVNQGSGGMFCKETTNGKAMPLSIIGNVSNALKEYDYTGDNRVITFSSTATQNVA